MFGFNTTYIHLIFVSFPIVFITTAALPHHGMLFIPQFDKFRSISCGDISPERIHSFFVKLGMSSAGLFVAIVLIPVLVRSVLRWWNSRPREREQTLFGEMALPAGSRREGGRAEGDGGMEVGEERQSLIFGENPDYHDNPDSTNPTPCPPQHHTNPVRHLRIHSFDELPPPTMEDVTPPRSPWGYPVNPVYKSEFSREKAGRRRSPFNPIIPGMKTTWEEGMDPVTGRKWRRKLVIYSGALDPLQTAGGELRIRENDRSSEP